MMINNVVLELLSAGVSVALVTGVFSLVIAIKNNRRLLDLENSKQRFTVTQERFKALREAYRELLNMLPEEKCVGHVIMNLPLQDGFQENGLASSYEIAENNMKIMYSHFQKYGYLLLDDEQKKVSSSIEELDNIAKVLISAKSELKLYNIDQGEYVSDISKSVTTRIIKISEFEEMYFNLYKNCLSKMSKLDSDA